MNAQSELIVILNKEVQESVLNSELPRGVRLLPLFQGDGKDGDDAIRAEMSRYYVASGKGMGHDMLAVDLRSRAWADAAYSKPAIECPVIEIENEKKAQRNKATVVPDFRLQQGYLGSAPEGINIAAAWKRSGGKGAGVDVLDIEGGWVLSHVDLQTNSSGLVDGTMYVDLYWRNHGTAVLGEIGGDEANKGITGIAPDAMLGAVSHYGRGAARSIEAAAQRLKAGDILLLEMHSAGPRFNYEPRDDQRGYIAVEWWPDTLLAIRYAISRGIIVVEAAGNGAEDFDDPFYDQPHPGFPATWVNPLGGRVDSGAILVGAGVTPGYGVDRSRFYYSNFGKRVDCQGWGGGVVTAGYGDFFQHAENAADETYWYTDRFAGTSSASPIVAGAVACLQGIAKRQKPPQLLTPERVREALRKTGSAQQAAPTSPLTQNIGKRPELGALCKFLKY